MFREQRIALGISQSKLARLSGVSRFKICTYELGEASLRPEQYRQIIEALRTEAQRLCQISAGVCLDQPTSVPAAEPTKPSEPLAHPETPIPGGLFRSYSNANKRIVITTFPLASLDE